jgi:hypothetical protein
MAAEKSAKAVPDWGAFSDRDSLTRLADTFLSGSGTGEKRTLYSRLVYHKITDSDYPSV